MGSMQVRPQLNFFSSLHPWKLNNRYCPSHFRPSTCPRGFHGAVFTLGIALHLGRHAGHACGAECQTVSHKIEFSFLNGNLMVPASQLPIFEHDTFPNGGGIDVRQFGSGQPHGTIIPLLGDGGDLLPAGQPYASSPCALRAARPRP
jgi:hypothetical protein